MLVKLLRKDLLLLCRNLKTILSLFFFSLLLAFVFSFSFRALGLISVNPNQLLPAILVVTILFVSCLLFTQTVLAEREEGALLSLIFAGYDGTCLFLSKLITNYLVLVLIFTSFLLELQLFYAEIPRGYIEKIGLVALPFSLSIASLGTMLSLISAVSKNRDLLFSILFFPLSLPTVGAGLELFRSIVYGGTLELTSFAMIVLLVSALIYTTLGAILFEEAI